VHSFKKRHSFWRTSNPFLVHGEKSSECNKGKNLRAESQWLLHLEMKIKVSARKIDSKFLVSNMEKEHYCFEMSRGYCHITKDHVLLSKESNLKQVTASDTFFRQYGMKIYRLLLIPFLIYVGYDDFLDGDIFGVCLTLFLVAFLISTTIVSFKYSLKQKIERK